MWCDAVIGWFLAVFWFQTNIDFTFNRIKQWNIIEFFASFLLLRCPWSSCWRFNCNLYFVHWLVGHLSSEFLRIKHCMVLTQFYTAIWFSNIFLWILSVFFGSTITSVVRIKFLFYRSSLATMPRFKFRWIGYGEDFAVELWNSGQRTGYLFEIVIFIWM